MEDLSPAQQEQVKKQLSKSPTPKKTTKDCNTRYISPTKNVCVSNNLDISSISNTHTHAHEKIENYELADYANPKSRKSPPFKSSRGAPNNTEEDYNNRILLGTGRYEPITLRLPGGNYTPDWMTVDDGQITFHECKGAYRFGSESRAILAFLSAAAAFPFWNFVWAKKQKGGKWVVKHAIKAEPLNNEQK